MKTILYSRVFNLIANLITHTLLLIIHSFRVFHATVLLYCRYLQERFKQVQEEVGLLKSDIQKYKVRLGHLIYLFFNISLIRIMSVTQL